jgi:hypothetical protein
VGFPAASGAQGTYLDPFAVELGVDLPGAVDAQVRLVRDLDVLNQLRVTNTLTEGGRVLAAE